VIAHDQDRGADDGFVRHAILFGLVAVFAVLILVLFMVTRQRGPTTFTIEPGAERTFPAEELIPGDRFSCHGSILPRQGAGHAADGSDGTFIGTDTEGDVTVRCPAKLEPV
jgi:hypothetical protein